MKPSTTNVFALSDRLSRKAGPDLVAADEQHFAAIAQALEHAVADLTERLVAERRAPARGGQVALDRDLEVHRLTARLRTLRRFGLDLCLGRTFPADGSEPVHVGRLGLTDPAGRRLLVDWRSPASAPFFAATPAQPMGLAARRRYRWTRGRITDYWDEVIDPGALERLGQRLALDDDSAFLAGLGISRSERMRDVLATLQSDQDAVVRAGSAGALVVDGGPGTGKTVVALHRAAYLLYADPRLQDRRGGILFVGPHQPYLAYVADVLPSLGEEGVQTCTLRDLLPEGAAAVPEPDPEVTRLKAGAAVEQAVEAAVRLYEEPPTTGLTVSTPWADLRLTPADWADAFTAPDPGTPHNEARDRIHEELADILLDRVQDRAVDEDVPVGLLRRAVLQDADLRTALHRAWPLLEPGDLVADLWAVPAYLKACAPWFTPDQRRGLHRPEGSPWTVADLPWLDAARRRLGDADASRRRRRREAALAARQAEMAQVVDHLVESDDSEMKVMSMLRVSDLQGVLADGAALEQVADPDLLGGPFAHVVVDEAQELTDAEWSMLLARCPSRSLTVVGDRAQARHGFAETWQQRLERVGVDRVALASMTVNYRTPVEVMAEAEPVIRAAVPDANVPTSIRSTGIPVRHGTPAELGAVLAGWLAAHADGTACVIARAPAPVDGLPEGVDGSRVRVLTPELAKGLEFDLVVLLDPASFGDGVEGTVDRYVAMTRATQRLVVLGG